MTKVNVGSLEIFLAWHSIPKIDLLSHAYLGDQVLRRYVYPKVQKKLEYSQETIQYYR